MKSHDAEELVVLNGWCFKSGAAVRRDIAADLRIRGETKRAAVQEDFLFLDSDPSSPTATGSTMTNGDML